MTQGYFIFYAETNAYKECFDYPNAYKERFDNHFNSSVVPPKVIQDANIALVTISSFRNISVNVYGIYFHYNGFVNNHKAFKETFIPI